MEFTQIKETCFYSENLDTIKEFYHAKLKLPIISEVPYKLIFFRAGSSVLLCFNPKYSKDQADIIANLGFDSIKLNFVDMSLETEKLPEVEEYEGKIKKLEDTE